MWRTHVSEGREGQSGIRCGFALECGGCGGCGGLRHIEGSRCPQSFCALHALYISFSARITSSFSPDNTQVPSDSDVTLGVRGSAPLAEETQTPQTAWA